ncbi:MAG TPA: hypothetical protein VMJ93_16010 [Verrucomicrobiae bacterium]|nr:hypothetical protein [Verrucomicrobiae bacterium]
MARRKKISTTISPEAFAALNEMIRSGRAKNLAEALDHVLAALARQQNRERLERATAEYYSSASREVIDEENELAAGLAASVPDLLFDE